MRGGASLPRMMAAPKRLAHTDAPADRRSAGGCMAVEGQSRRTQSGPGRRYSPQHLEKQLRLATSPRDHLADDFRHQGIRQDYRKARRVRQLPAMRFDESDAVEKQRFGAPTHKRNATCGDEVQCVRIEARRRKDRWALERFPFVALGRDLRGDRNEDAEPAIARETGDGRRDDPVGLEQKAALEMKPPECAGAQQQYDVAAVRLEC